MQAGTARVGPALGVPLLGFALMAATVAWGLSATATGHELGVSLPPLLYEFSPRVQATTPVLAIGLELAAWLAPRLRSEAIKPAHFALAVLALGLALRLGLGTGRGDLMAALTIGAGAGS